MDDERPTQTISSVVPAAEHDLLVPGTSVGDYEIDGEIGHGGMGVVYRATHPVIGKRAAIKVLRRDMAKSRDTVDRFIQEARSVNQIGHPNIVDIFAFGTLADGRPYLMMDLLVGESLRTRLKRGPLHVSEAASILDEVASALDAAHAKGVIHRDLKPDNVFLVERQGRWPEVKLLDFGLAKLVSSIDTPVRTHTGIMLGTPDYMAPEQIRRRGVVDERVDIYALGVMAFESLTGRRPLPKSQGYDDLVALAEQPAPELAQVAPHVPKDLAYLVDGMLLKDAAARPSLADVRATFKRLRAVLPSMSVASLEIQLPARPEVNHSLGGLTASRVGAEPLLPSLAVPMGSPAPSSGPVRTMPGTMPPVAPSGPIALPSDQLSAARVRAAADDDEEEDLLETTNPRDKAKHIREKAAAFAALAEAQKAQQAQQAQQAQLRTSGLGPSSAATNLGIGVPINTPRIASAPYPAAVVPAPGPASTTAPVTAPAPQRRGGFPWLVVGALLAVAAGIALALALAS